MNKQHFTIGQVAKKFSISRSTLIYYDSIGLLKPTGRANNNYRIYLNSDIERMEKISKYREAGLSLQAITRILSKESNNKSQSILEKRLFSINEEIQVLRYQQKIVLQLLENKELINHSRILTKEKWVMLLQATGLDENDMQKWHREFEKMSPEAHQDFLESLGINQTEIKSIREFSKNKKTLKL